MPLRPAHLPVLLAVALLLSHAAPRVATAEPPTAEVAAVRRLLKDPSPSARAAAARRLTGSSDPGALDVLVGCLDDPHAYVRRAAAGVLGLVPEPAARERLAREAARWKSETARREACQTWSLWLDDVGRRALLAALTDPVADVRVEALRWLSEDRDPAVRAAVRARLGDADPQVRAEALDALSLSPDPLTPTLTAADVAGLLRDRDARVRLSALDAAVAMGGAGGAEAVVRALGDASWSVRLEAADLAPRTLDRRVLPALVQALKDERKRVAETAGRALVKMTRIPFDPDPAVWGAWLEGDGRSFDPAGAPPDDAPPPRPPPPVPAGTRTVEGARFLDLPIVSRHVAFVLDGSGSMKELRPDGRTRWAEVVAELDQALGRLSGAAVNVAVFSDEVAAALPRSQPLDAPRREALLRFVRGRAPGGKTALYDGVAWGLADPEVDTLVVLSDGAPSAGTYFTKSDLLAEVRRANRWRRARIDVIAVGADGVAQRWRDALQRLAQDSGGACLVR